MGGKSGSTMVLPPDGCFSLGKPERKPVDKVTLNHLDSCSCALYYLVQGGKESETFLEGIAGAILVSSTVLKVIFPNHSFINPRLVLFHVPLARNKLRRNRKERKVMECHLIADDYWYFYGCLCNKELHLSSILLGRKPSTRLDQHGVSLLQRVKRSR